MKKYLEKIFFNLTGGRPMIDCGLAFIDTLSNKSVRYYKDHFGRQWMAEDGEWSLFRVKRNKIQGNR